MKEDPLLDDESPEMKCVNFYQKGFLYGGYQFDQDVFKIKFGKIGQLKPFHHFDFQLFC